MKITTQTFWQFSLANYQIEQVQTTLLSAQGSHNLNVNLALFCLFLNQQKVYLTEEQLIQLNFELTEFNNQFTGHLRALRLEFKAAQPKLLQYDKLRKLLLDAELLLEQQEQDLLVGLFNQYSDFSALHSDNLTLYQDLLSGKKSKANNSTLKLSDLNQYIH